MNKQPVKGDVFDVLFGIFLIALGVVVGLSVAWDLTMLVIGRDNWFRMTWLTGVLGMLLILVGVRFMRRYH